MLTNEDYAILASMDARLQEFQIDYDAKYDIPPYARSTMLIPATQIPEPPAPPEGYRVKRVGIDWKRTLAHGYIQGVNVEAFVASFNARLAEDACICARAWSDVAGQGLGAIYDIAKGEWSTWSYDNL